MTVAAQLPPVTLETLDGYPVMRWMDMQAWAENFEGMMWVHLLIDAYVGSYGHYFVVDGDITMLLDPPLWEKFQISMASQPGTLVPVDSCSINGVIVKPYMPPAMVKGEDKFLGVMLIKQDGTTQVITSQSGETTVTIGSGLTSIHDYVITNQDSNDMQVLSSTGDVVMTVNPGESKVWESKPTHMEVEIGEYERLKAVERAYNILCEQSRAGQ